MKRDVRFYSLVKPWRSFARCALIGAVLASMVACPVTSLGEDIMLTSGNSSVFINPDSGAGVYYWLVDGVNHLAKQWWWYRFGDTPERPIETLGPVVPIRYAPNLVELRYTGTEVDAVLRYTLVGGLPGSGSATLSESVRLQNKTTVPADLHLFEYTDFDLFGTAADDTAVLVNRSTISQWDGAILATETSTVGGITPLPSRWEIAEYPWLLGKLNDSKPDFLAEQVTPFGPGNATFAFQWDFQICPGCSQLLSKSKIISPAGAIGDTVWYDSNRNGLLDAGETGIPNVRIILEADLDGNGTVDYTTETTTDGNGYYLFANLPGGTYTVTVDTSTLPAGLSQTYDLDGLGTPHTATIYLPSGTVNLDVDFGYVGEATLGNYVWLDTNGNGIQDDGDLAGVNGVLVELLDTTGQVIATTITANSPTTGLPGWYQFTVAPGTYVVKIADSNFEAGGPLEGALASPRYSGSNDELDSDGDPVLHTSGPVTVAVDEHRTDIDFGFLRGQPQCIPEGTSNCPNPVGVLFWTLGANGDVYVRYEQSRYINDNSYGAGIVQWPRSHSFNDLVGSDKAEFVFRDTSGKVVLQFYLDCISQKSGTPSGYASLGVTGGDGKMLVGSASQVLEWNTGIAHNLNELGLCVSGNCTVGGVNLLVNSPPADANYNVLNPVFSQWDFTNWYWVRVSGAAFGTAGFGSVAVASVHNSPPKCGVNAIYPVPCVTTGPTECDLQLVAYKFKDRELQLSLKNVGTAKATIGSATLTWPKTNGKLKEIKLNGDKIFDQARVPPTTTVTAWKGDVNKRTIEPGNTEVLKLVFEKKASTVPTAYSIHVEFTQGCTFDWP